MPFAKHQRWSGGGISSATHSFARQAHFKIAKRLSHKLSNEILNRMRYRAWRAGYACG